jgi:hypothetical protein
MRYKIVYGEPIEVILEGKSEDEIRTKALRLQQLMHGVTIESMYRVAD